MSDTTNISGRLDQLGLAVPRTPEADRERGALGQTEFFELMVAQLKNQDPLKPLESNEFLSQIAQFSTVDGITGIEKSMTDLASSLQSSQALQASALVGREVLVPSAVATLGDGGGIVGAIDLDSGASNLRITISDPAGNVVRQVPMGGQSAGRVDFSWDGLDADGNRAPSGYYELAATVSGSDGDLAVPVLTRSRVASVTLSKNPPGVVLNLPGVGSIDVNEVRELL